MTFRPAERTRERAVPMEPMVDPAGWHASDLAANSDWMYELDETETTEVRAAVAEVERRGLDILDMRREDFAMPRFDEALGALYDELLDGRGFVVIRGIPVSDFTKAQSAAAFWAIGTRFGDTLSQNRKGHMLGHVKDFGGDYADPNVRGYQTSAEMSFHSDQCDYVALLCMQPSKAGGESRITSTVTIYNEMLKECPELAKELTADFYQTLHGEVQPGGKPWYKMPVFSFHEGFFSARGAGAHARKAQSLPGVPAFTDAQNAAFDTFQDMSKRLCFNMDFRPGDIQILHNHLAVHTRTAFEDWPEPERKRHLMRLWLNDWAGRPLVSGFRENNQGIQVAGMMPSTPVDSFEPA